MQNLLQKFKIILFFIVIILFSFGFTEKASASYFLSGNWTSTNLLSGETVLNVGSIDSFVYNLSAKPANTDATIQFSQDNTNWYDSSGVLDASDTLTTGLNNTIDLSSLGWTGANFYYKIFFTSSDGVSTPVLDDVSLVFTYAPDTPTNSTPADGATAQDLNVVLVGSTYSDTESDAQTDTDWQVDDDANFATPVWTRTAGEAEATTTINTTNGTFANELAGDTELDHDTTYYWRVRYSDGAWSNWSASTTFTTNDIQTPSNQSPANGTTLTTLTPLLEADAFVDGQSGHTHTASQWLVDNNSDFSSVVYDSGETESAETSRAVPGYVLTNYSTYYWKVRYKDSSGFWSSYSTSTNFSIQISETAVDVQPVFGKITVDQGDAVKIDTQVLNFTDGSPLNSATSTINIYNPSGSKIVDGATMTYVSGSNGIYRYAYTVPSVSGSYLYEVIATQGSKSGYGASNFEVKTIATDISSTKSTVEAEQTAQSAERALQEAERTAQTIERASSTVERTAQEIERTAQTTERASSTAERVAQAESRTKVEDVQTKVSNIQDNMDVLIGAMVVTQSTVNDVSATTSSFVTALTNAVDNFYNNAVLTFTSGNLDGQTRRISDYDGASKTIFLSPALTSAPANADAFTIVKQNVYVEEQLAEHETAQAISRTKVEDIQTKVTDIQSTVNTTYSLLQTVDGKIDTIDTNVDSLLTNLQIVDDSVDAIVTKWGTSSAEDIVSDISGVKTVVDSIRSSQQLNYTIELSDVEAVLTGNTYRAKLSILNYESQLTDAVSSPNVTLYDPTRDTVTTSTMTKLSTGVYEYTYSVPSDATSGTWETVVSVDLGGDLAISRQDYWEVRGSPAQVIINAISDLSVPSITANVTISNEGAASYEYQYEWCVVSTEDNACGGGDDVFYSSAAKYILTGEDWDTSLNATVPDTGNYWFKVVVYYGTETSGSSQTFIATEEDGGGITTGSSSSGSGTTSLSLTAVYNKLLEVQNELGFHGKTKTAFDDMKTIKGWVGALPEQLSQPMYEEISNISKSLGGMDGTTEVNFSSPAFQALLDISKVNATDLQEMKNKLADLRAVSSVTRKLVEQTITEPIVETWMTFDSVVFNFLITNPLNENKTLQFKSYLPTEVKPEHIIDLSGLSIDYDSSASSYYVWGNITLGPKEAVTKKVEIKDIWVFANEEIESLKKQAETLAKPLEKTQYDAMGAVLKNEIDTTLDIILLTQKSGFRTPQDHIVAHRANEAKMELVKKDLEKLKDLVVQSGASQGVVGKVGGIQTFATWGIILAVVFGFGLLAIIIFAMWRHQTMLAMATMSMDKKEILALLGKKKQLKKKPSKTKKSKSVTLNANSKIKFESLFTRVSFAWRLLWKKILIWIVVVGIVVVFVLLAIKFVPSFLSQKEVELNVNKVSEITETPASTPTLESIEEVSVIFDDSPKLNSDPVESVEDVTEQFNKLIILDTPTGWLNVRDGASLDGKIIAKVYPNEQYEYTDEKNNWYFITISENKSGWVFEDYVQKNEN